MQNSVEIDITQVMKTFSKLPRTTRNKALRPALRAGATVIKDQAVLNLKRVVRNRSTGIGARSITVYNLRQSQGRLRVAVAVKRGAVNKYKIVNGKPVRVGLYLSVLDYGKHDQPPTGWMRGAARQKESAALNAIASEAAKRLDSALQAAKA